MTLRYSTIFGSDPNSGSINGDWVQITHTITSQEASAKEFTITAAPLVPSEVVVDIVGGSPQQYNEDYTIIGDKFNWATYALDGVLDTNDTIRLAFFMQIN